MSAPAPLDRSQGFAPSAVHVSRGASYLIIQTLVMNGAQVVSFAILARLITTKEMGILAVLQLILSVCVTFATLGIPQAATKFVAENFSRGERHAASAVLYQSMRATFLSSLPFSVVIFLAAPFLASTLLQDVSYALLFQILAVDILVYSGLLQVLASSLLGLQMFRETATVGIIVTTFLRQTLIIGLIILLRNFMGLVIAWAISDSVAALAYLVYVWRLLGRPRFDFPLGRILRFSWPLSVSSVAGFAQTWFDRALLVAFVPLATLGIYNAVITSFSVLSGVSGQMSSVLFPAYSAMQGKDQRKNLTEAVRLSSRYVGFVMVPLTLGLFATARPALTLFVGQAYLDGTQPLMILTAIYALTVTVSTALSPMFLALEETRVASAIGIASVGVSLAAAFVLLPMYGIIGASEARGLAFVMAAILTVWILGKKIRLDIDIRGTAKILISGAIMAVAVMIAQIPHYSKFLLPVYVLVGLIVYVAMLRVLRAVRSEDIDLIERYLGGRLPFVTKLLHRILQ